METRPIPVVKLREPLEADAAVHAALPISDEIHRMFGGKASLMPPRTLEYSKGWVDWLQSHPFGRIIEVDGHAAGEIRLHSLSEPNQSARMAVGLFTEDLLGRGIGRRAIGETLSVAFDQMGLHRVDLKVLEFNTRAIRCYQACGFEHEGTLRQSAKLDTGWHDEWIMAILEPGFRKKLARSPDARD